MVGKIHKWDTCTEKKNTLSGTTSHPCKGLKIKMEVIMIEEIATIMIAICFVLVVTKQTVCICRDDREDKK